jgi:hypothetical protein
VEVAARNLGALPQKRRLAHELVFSEPMSSSVVSASGIAMSSSFNVYQCTISGIRLAVEVLARITRFSAGPTPQNIPGR